MLGSILVQSVIVVWKHALQKRFKKGAPSRSNEDLLYSQARRLQETQPRMRTFQTRRSCLSNSWSTVRNSSRKKWTGFEIVAKKVNEQLKIVDNYCKQLKHALKHMLKEMLKQILMIWLALGKGPAIFLYMLRFPFYLQAVSCRLFWLLCIAWHTFCLEAVSGRPFTCLFLHFAWHIAVRRPSWILFCNFCICVGTLFVWRPSRVVHSGIFLYTWHNFCPEAISGRQFSVASTGPFIWRCERPPLRWSWRGRVQLQTE